jgi:hypothetical protein
MCCSVEPVIAGVLGVAKTPMLNDVAWRVDKSLTSSFNFASMFSIFSLFFDRCSISFCKIAIWLIFELVFSSIDCKRDNVSFLKSLTSSFISFNELNIFLLLLLKDQPLLNH